MTFGNLPAPARVLLVHKHITSARVRFLRYEDGIVGPVPLPKLAQVLEADEAAVGGAVVEHPAVLVGRVAADLGLNAGDIEVEPAFRAYVDTPQGVSTIYLGLLTAIDPPFEAATQVGARFIAMTEAGDLTPTELELMRQAYICLMD